MLALRIKLLKVVAIHCRIYHDRPVTRIAIEHKQKQRDALAWRNKIGMTFRIDDLEIVTKPRQWLGNPPSFVRYVLGQRPVALGGPPKGLRLEEAQPYARLEGSGAVHTSLFSMMVNPDSCPELAANQFDLRASCGCSQHVSKTSPTGLPKPSISDLRTRRHVTTLRQTESVTQQQLPRGGVQGPIRSFATLPEVKSQLRIQLGMADMLYYPIGRKRSLIVNFSLLGKISTGLI